MYLEVHTVAKVQYLHKSTVEPTIGQLFQCRLYLGPKGFARDR
jgi:hypothetical protein